MKNLVYKHGLYHLAYTLTHRPGRPLVIIFSAVDNIPGRCVTSYFGYQHRLDASVLHILDNFGAHGCYYMRLNGSDDIAKAYSALIKSVMAQCHVTLEQTWFCGTSKGATAALYHALELGGGNCILGEPQIHIGDFLFDDAGPKSESARAIAYVMTGRVAQEDRENLNALFLDHIRTHLRQWSGRAILHVSENTGYLWRHVRHLQTLLVDFPEARHRFDIRADTFLDHNEVSEVFKVSLEAELGGLLPLTSESVIFKTQSPVGALRQTLDVVLEPGRTYEVSYSLIAHESQPNGKAAVFSVQAASDLAEFEGLMRSPLADIGYFRYLSSRSDDALAYFQFSVPTTAEIARVELVPWENKEPGDAVLDLSVRPI